MPLITLKRTDWEQKIARFVDLPGRPQAWSAGRSPPPRASEGLNDPISVAAVFHFAISREEENRDPILRATLAVLRSVLDDRTEAETYACRDLAHFGPAWRAIRERVHDPFEDSDLAEIAERVFGIAATTGETTSIGTQVVAVDGRRSIFRLPRETWVG